jgi:hypothetical protein
LAPTLKSTRHQPLELQLLAAQVADPAIAGAITALARVAAGPDRLRAMLRVREMAEHRRPSAAVSTRPRPCSAHDALTRSTRTLRNQDLRIVGRAEPGDRSPPHSQGCALV